MSAEIVIKKLESYEHFGFKWIAAGSGGFHHWVTADAEAAQPKFITCGLCCFHLPLAMAIEAGCMTCHGAGTLIVDPVKSDQIGQPPGKRVPAGLTKYRTFPLVRNTPKRDDVVFFSGHGAPYLQGGLHARMVERMSIAAVKRVNKALTEVHFGTPA